VCENTDTHGPAYHQFGDERDTDGLLYTPSLSVMPLLANTESFETTLLHTQRVSHTATAFSELRWLDDTGDTHTVLTADSSGFDHNDGATHRGVVRR
jgi:hypothetical protein